jgi:hypothetical protein
VVAEVFADRRQIVNDLDAEALEQAAPANAGVPPQVLANALRLHFTEGRRMSGRPRQRTHRRARGVAAVGRVGM